MRSYHILSRILSASILIFALCLAGCGQSVSPEAAEETVPSTETTELMSPLEQEVQQISQRVQSLQVEGSVSFLAFADTHFNGTDAAAIELAGEASAMIRDSVPIDFSVLLGGIAADASQFQQEALQCEVVDGYLKEAFADDPLFVALGEGDSYPVLPSSNPAQPHTFQDLEEHKLRVIVLNTADGENGVGMSAGQLQWLAESLDLSVKADAGEWGILLFSHLPLDYSNLLDSAGRILDAYLNGTAVDFTWDGQAISYSYEEKNTAEIIGNLHGHTHNFLADTLYLVNQQGAMYPSSIVRLCVPNTGITDCNPFAANSSTDSNGIEYGEATTYEKSKIGTSFNIITVDREEKIIHCTNFGEGNHRRIPYGAAAAQPEGAELPAGTYTNQVPLSTEFGRRNNTIFNETGYRNHTYLVCNDIDEEAWPYGNDAEYVTTGAIPFTVPSYLTPPVIYIWGAELDEADHTRFFIYDSQKYRLVLQATGPEFKNYFTIEELGEQYYRLTPIPEGKASVLFPATNGRAGRGSIAFSLKGTGENLVITVGEPILPE